MDSQPPAQETADYADIEFVEGNSRIKVLIKEGTLSILRKDGSSVSITVRNGDLTIYPLRVNITPRSQS